jgi:hypothetical protein
VADEGGLGKRRRSRAARSREPSNTCSAKAVERIDIVYVYSKTSCA